MQNTPKEWNLIDVIKYRVQRQNKNTVVPLGDDAFVFKNFPGYSVICQDMMVEDVHFKTDYCSAYSLGHKSLAVNLSDIAAMGARPHFIQCSLSLPAKYTTESWLDDFYKGMVALADEHGCEVIGGDLTASTDKISIDVSVYGSCEHPLTRKGVKSGDLLLSSGPLGLSYTGFLALNKNINGYEEAKKKHTQPLPRLDLVQTISQNHQKIHALMDCSDGLVNDSLQLIPENGGLHIFEESLPVHQETAQLAIDLGRSVTELVLWGGEDYELLMAIHPDDYSLFQDWKLIGQFTNSPGVFLTDSHAQKEIKEFKGWKHF
ncbi:thiamine-phosphate kinase [Bdellovibrio reynosensis]|uniref:Thiamine-monophosphate kinase n=1 Tax=Bdellovibrio reynosensis TaxID=2835041 RepID=A0ABY4CDM4_9BACT|nr:thiamine-phosphate kinase [Bdellovibrio reynosensis]UOF02829.1 thiamine-phosphate kinase [Bdellovibrio reynosensis]